MAANALMGQIARYAISGAGLTAFYTAVYWGTAVPLGVPPLVANTIAFVLTFAIGYVIHSRWSFRGHGSRAKPVRGYARFLVVNLLAYGLNSFWVWLIVERLGSTVGMSILPIAFVTPWFSFWMNRVWTFR